MFFRFVRYQMEHIHDHRIESIVFKSENFLKAGKSIITFRHLLSGDKSRWLREFMTALPRDQQQAWRTAEITGLREFR